MNALQKSNTCLMPMVHFRQWFYLLCLCGLTNTPTPTRADAYDDSLLGNSDYPAYINYNFKKLEEARATEHCAQIAKLSSNVGRGYYYLKQTSKTVGWFHAALAALKTCRNDTLKGILYKNLGSVWLDAGRADSAAVYYTKATPLIETYSDLKHVSNFYSVQFELWFRHLKNEAKAKEMLRLALETAYQSADSSVIFFAETKRAIYYMETGQCRLAIPIYENIYRYAASQKDLEGMIYALSGIQSNHIRCGNTEETEKARYEWSNLKDSFFSLKVADATAKYETKFLTQQKEIENQKLKQRNVQMVGIGVFIIVMLVSVGLVWAERRENKQKALFELELREEQRKRFAEVLTAQEQEQARIAGDLHDSLGHLISAAKLNLSVLEASTDRQQQLLQNLNKIVDEAGFEARNLAHRIMPQSLSELGLKESLRELATRINKTGKITISLQADTLDESSLSQGKKIALYRISQELLNNMIKHANATHIQIVLKSHNQSTELRISDNGQGFDVNEMEKSQGLGWRNNKSRIEILKGEFRIESTKGAGTGITIILPNHD